MDKQIETLKKLREDLNEESCLPKEPFMKLGTGTAPQLNYNLPQSACFSTYGDVPVEVNNNVFKAECSKIPENNYFTQVEKIEPITLKQKFVDGSSFIGIDAVWPAGMNLINGYTRENVKFGAIKLKSHRNTNIVEEDGLYVIYDFSIYFTEDNLPTGWNLPDAWNPKKY